MHAPVCINARIFCLCACMYTNEPFMSLYISLSVWTCLPAWIESPELTISTNISGRIIPTDSSVLAWRSLQYGVLGNTAKMSILFKLSLGVRESKQHPTHSLQVLKERSKILSPRTNGSENQMFVGFLVDSFIMKQVYLPKQLGVYQQTHIPLPCNGSLILV